MENKLFSSTLAKKKELKTYLVLFWDNAEYLGLYLACNISTPNFLIRKKEPQKNVPPAFMLTDLSRQDVHRCTACALSILF